MMLPRPMISPAQSQSSGVHRVCLFVHVCVHVSVSACVCVCTCVCVSACLCVSVSERVCESAMPRFSANHTLVRFSCRCAQVSWFLGVLTNIEPAKDFSSKQGACGSLLHGHVKELEVLCALHKPKQVCKGQDNKKNCQRLTPQEPVRMCAETPTRRHMHMRRQRNWAHTRVRTHVVAFAWLTLLDLWDVCGAWWAKLTHCKCAILFDCGLCHDKQVCDINTQTQQAKKKKKKKAWLGRLANVHQHGHPHTGTHARTQSQPHWHRDRHTDTNLTRQP